MSNGRLILSGELHLLSPLLIGSGQKENTDSDVLLDAEQKPFIPATSLAGILRHTTLGIRDTSNKDLFDQFWGKENKDSKGSANSDGRGSHITLYDSNCLSEYTVLIRDGIRINSKTGLVEDEAKFNYEVLDAGVKFSFEIRIQYQGQHEQTFAMKILSNLKQILESGQLAAGAKTNNGLGKLQLQQAAVYHYDFSQPDHVKAWLSRDSNKQYEACKLQNLHAGFDYTSSDFELEFLAELSSSMMVRGYPNGLIADKLPDDMMLHSNGNPVLPGSSFKGVLRKRAEQILNTLEKDSSKVLNSLFGWTNTEQSAKGTKGRLSVSETYLQNTQLAMQTRIKIDRFTGGTIESALFQTMPVFAMKNPDKPHLALKIKIKNCKPEEAGLVMLLLKDLWTGDLALGGEKNVGRGRLMGRQAILKWPEQLDQAIQFKQINDIQPEIQSLLNQWVKELGKTGSVAA